LIQLLKISLAERTAKHNLKKQNLKKIEFEKEERRKKEENVSLVWFILEQF
jgi:hypothetical protein